MYIVLPELYRHLAEELVDRIDRCGYFSGRVELEDEHLSCCLVVSTINYFDERQRIEGSMLQLSDVVPVWWEFHTCIDNEEVINDFSFNELRRYIQQTVEEN